MCTGLRTILGTCKYYILSATTRDICQVQALDRQWGGGAATKPVPALQELKEGVGSGPEDAPITKHITSTSVQVAGCGIGGD